MATTRIIPMHLNKGKTLAQCLADRTEYGMNPDKTEGGALISAFACEPETAVSEFALSKREYRELTGRLLCELANKADRVERIVCGIGERIK